MDFFRRIFNNPSEDTSHSSEEQPATISTSDSKSTGVATEPLDGKPETQPTEADTTSTELPDTLPNRSVTEAEQEDIKGTAPLPSEEPMGITRPLPQEPVFQTQSGHLIFGQLSDQGMVRTNNQDSAMSFFFTSDSVDDKPDFGVFIVADGMGGHKEGEKASALTATTVMQDIFQSIYLPMLSDNDDDMHADRPTITEALTEAVRRANINVREKVKDGGTTITAVVVFGDQAYIAHVGDSRAYLISPEQEIEQLTRDHSVVQRLIELGQLTPEEAEVHDQRNVLYRAIGQNEEVEVDILRRRLPSNSQILLCSDGLWGLMANDDIRSIIIAAADPQEACDKLIALANTNGGADNITAVLLKMPGSE